MLTGHNKHKYLVIIHKRLTAFQSFSLAVDAATIAVPMAHCVFIDRRHFIITGQHKRHRTSAVGSLDRERWVIHQWSVCKVLTNNSLFFGRIGLCWWGTGDVGFIVGLKLGQGAFPKCLGLEWDLINNLAAQFRVDIPGWWWSADPGEHPSS